MPQLAPGGKFVFGWSIINDDYTIQPPKMAVEEYSSAAEGKVILMSGSKTTGGFSVSRKSSIEKSKMAPLLDANPSLRDYKLREGEVIEYNGRFFCWLSISKSGSIKLNDEILRAYSIKIGDRLLAIRGSCVGFAMGAKGRLIGLARNYEGEIEVY